MSETVTGTLRKACVIDDVTIEVPGVGLRKAKVAIPSGSRIKVEVLSFDANTDNLGAAAEALSDGPSQLPQGYRDRFDQYAIRIARLADKAFNICLEFGCSRTEIDAAQCRIVLKRK